MTYSVTNFLDEIKKQCLSGGVDEYVTHDAIVLLGTLGENGRRMLEIGIVQDKLVKLGFTVADVDLELENGGTVNITEFFSNNIYNYLDEDSGETLNVRFHIVFEYEWCTLHYTKQNSSDDNYEYIDSSTFDDVLNKVKELIK